MLHIVLLVIGAPYGGYAGVVYWRLRKSAELSAEIAETQALVLCTRPLHVLAPVLVPAMPVIAEVTSVANGLLWPVEMITRPWRFRQVDPHGGHR